LLDYCIVEQTADYAYAFVKISGNLSAGNVVICIYYGNAAENSVSSGPNTFNFWEDGELGNLSRWDSVPAGWTNDNVVKKNGVYSVKGMRVNGGVLSKTMPASVQTKGRVVFWTRATALSGTFYNYIPTNNLGNYNCHTVMYIGGHWRYYNGTIYQNLPVDTLWTGQTWYKTELVWNYDTLKLDIWIGKAKKSNAGIVDALKGTSQTKIGFYTCSSSGSGQNIDDVFVTKYTSPEPAHGTTEEEETPVTAPPPGPPAFYPWLKTRPVPHEVLQVIVDYYTVKVSEASHLRLLNSMKPSGPVAT
jgi:hypothetical protein